MMLDSEICNEARLRRDPAFDGKFFTAVRTTKIYCRLVCPVKHPLTKNVGYFPTAAAAEQAGYRPCLRCRPETAPFCAAWNGTRTTVARALKLIEGGFWQSQAIQRRVREALRAAAVVDPPTMIDPSRASSSARFHPRYLPVRLEPIRNRQQHLAHRDFFGDRAACAELDLICGVAEFLEEAHRVHQAERLARPVGRFP